MHCHLLPHVDDGAAEWGSLSSYFSLYKKCGFTGVIFTPHLYSPYVSTDVKALGDTFKRASALAEESGLSSSLASEIFVLNEERVKGLPIANRYALVEFPVSYAPPGMMEKLETLSPLIPVIAHIERYDWLTPESPVIMEMKDRGYLIQVNGKALAKGGKAKEYAESGLVDILASDCHGNEKDIIDLAEMASCYPEILGRMTRMARLLKEEM